MSDQEKEKLKEMIQPVLCTHCHKAYDLENVKVLSRQGDCIVFKTPCCKKQADDRDWKNPPDYSRISSDQVNDADIVGVV